MGIASRRALNTKRRGGNVKNNPSRRPAARIAGCHHPARADAGASCHALALRRTPLRLDLLPLLFLTGFSAGLVDAIAGGGGIISLPVLLNLGLPPQLALGTNKFQASAGSVAAACAMRAGGWSTCANAEPASCSPWWGPSRARSPSNTSMRRSWRNSCRLSWRRSWSIWSSSRGSAWRNDRRASVRSRSMRSSASDSGSMTASLGPGTGSFWAMAFVLLRGCALPRATAHTKVMNATSNVASLALFAAAGSGRHRRGPCHGRRPGARRAAGGRTRCPARRPLCPARISGDGRSDRGTPALDQPVPSMTPQACPLAAVRRRTFL